MIPIQAVYLLLPYLIFWFILLLALWLYGNTKRRANTDWSLLEEKIYHCNKCRISFIALAKNRIAAKCPSCQSYCFLRKKKKF